MLDTLLLELESVIVALRLTVLEFLLEDQIVPDLDIPTSQICQRSRLLL